MQKFEYVSNTKSGRLDDVPEPFRKCDSISATEINSEKEKDINTTSKRKTNSADSLFLLLVFLLFYDNM